MNLERFDLSPLELELFQVKEVVRCLLHSILFHRALNAIRPCQQECEVFDHITYAKIDDPAIAKTVDAAVERCYHTCEKITHAAHMHHQQQLIALQQAQQHNAAHAGGSVPGGGGSRMSVAGAGTGSAGTGDGAAPADGGVLCVGFYALQMRKTWFSAKEERVFWERWRIPITLVTDSSATQTYNATTSTANSGASYTNSANSGGGSRRSYSGVGSNGSSGSTGSKSGSSNLSSQQSDRDRRQAQRAAALLDRLMQIVMLVNEKKDHIPPLKSAGAVAAAGAPGGGVGGGAGGAAGAPSGSGGGSGGGGIAFPFDITFSTGDDAEDESWGIHTFKKMLKQGPPMLMK